ncbi:MAG: hypothetical protein LBU23_01495 [Planctomycetota bacterium]|jgi:hypothetical protein|nr:hypothetical protein [Planctomycetota bacterium]
MFAKLFARSDGGLRQRLLRLVLRKGGLILDARTLAELGTNLKRASRAACALASRERLHLLAEPDGSVAILSNPQFRQITLIRLSLPKPEAKPAPGKSRPPLRKPAVPAAKEPEYAWFTLEVAPAVGVRPAGKGGRDGRRKNPVRRQEMPNRRREPWVILDGACLEAE